jgi:CheY-like chemotaxis protein
VGEGLVGQAALEKERICLTNAPADYVQISSGLGEAAAQNIVVQPVTFEGQVKAVVEFASFNRFTDVQLAFLEQLSESTAIVLNTISATQRTEELLKQSQALTEELQTQQEELTETNKRLEAQADTLKQSEALLKDQRQELQQSNEELERRSLTLAQQKQEVESKNREVEQARQLLQQKAAQLAVTSKYKSAFLANMSHELRTPLNSLLILSKMLADNAEGNLSGKQVEFAQTIHSAGSDLLTLINDILDLSKIEAGTIELDLGELRFDAVRDFCEQTFRPVAEQKKLEFGIEISADLPAGMRADGRRVQQALKNLLSNAFKFTDRGSVRLTIRPATQGWSPDEMSLNQAESVVAFEVKDTGIGIAEDKRQIVFEAFQQADATISRKYAGTGLGLSISRQIAKLLGGEIRLESELGKGSTFTLYLPVSYRPPTQPPTGSASDERLAGPGAGAPASPNGAQPMGSSPVAGAAQVARDLSESEERGLIDDRESIQPGDRVLLIVEDDLAFAQILLDLARARGFKGLVATQAETALRLVRSFAVDAITLDLQLPDRSGWSVLDRLKHDGRTSHIPVHIISVAEEHGHRGLSMGAVGYLHKPATKEALDSVLDRLKEFIEKRVRKLLVVEDNEAQRKSIAELIGNHDVETTSVATGREALAALGKEPFDCMVLDLGLPDMTGFEVIERMKKFPEQKGLPIVIYSGKELSREEETELHRVAQAIVIKGVKSPERLLDETALFLHRVEANLPEEKRRLLDRMRKVDENLVGRKLLIVDDDIRNIFALSSVFQRYGIQTVYAENGKDGISMLEKTSGIDAVLMDIMMPEMDGYETIRAIRQIERFKHLPIIALTALAMKGDREKCLKAGASDYVTKPVDADQLLSLLRVWLYR